MNQFLDHHSKLPNEDLVEIAYFNRKAYTREARQSAKIILKQRNLSTTHLDALKDEIRNRKRKERYAQLKEKGNNNWFLNFIIDLLFAG